MIDTHIAWKIILLNKELEQTEIPVLLFDI